MGNMKIVATAFAIVLSGCGSDSPTSPTSSSLPAATIVGVGQFTQNGCIIVSSGAGLCDSLSFDVMNNGPGCALSTDLRGTVTIRNQAGAQIASSDWQLTLGSKTANNGIFRPGDRLQATGGSMTQLTGATTSSLSVTTQTNVRCP